jgi:hypothetical protein
MTKPIIAFTGLAQSGKTTAANALQTLGYDKVSFADPLKEMVRSLTNVTDKDARPPELCGKSLREIYQSLGTEWGRGMVGSDIWIHSGRRRLATLMGDVESGIIHGIVLDDVRFSDEASLVRELGGIVIEITRAGIERMAHASEAGISRELIDFTIGNEGSVEELWGAVLTVTGKSAMR